nr:reverse transcriptase domain-containing protein [Tanacetum cinerariifolium]
MLVEVGKFTFPVDFVILEIEEDSKVPLILGQPFLHTADAVIQVKQKQLNLGIGTKRMIFNIDSAMKHSYLNDVTCLSIDVIDEILEEYFDALLKEGSKILHSIEGTLLEEEISAEFDKFMAMISEKNSDSKSDTEEPPFKKITINTDYKIKTSLEEPPTNLKLKPLPDNLEYVFLEEPSFQHAMLFGLCNAPATFQRNSFKTCLINLDKMLQRCKDAHLVLNWENVTSWSKKELYSDTRCPVQELKSTKQRSKDAHLVLNWENITSWSRKELCLDTSGTNLATAAGTDLATPAGTDLATAAADQATAAGTDLAIAAGTDLAIAAGTDLATAAGTDLATAAGTDLANHSGTDLANHFGTRSKLFLWNPI